MGLIKQVLESVGNAATGSIGSALLDQFKEFIYCDALSADVLAAKGQKRTSRNSGNSGSDNIITNGSVVVVNSGQCMLIVDQGKVVDVCAEPGEYVYDKSTEPSIFTGGLKDSVAAMFEQMGRRFTFGGDTGKDQRVYYFNTKEIVGNKYGTPTAIPFKIDDEDLNIRQTIHVRCFGEYSYKIVNPLFFYENVCGNMADTFKRSEIDGQLKSELMTALQPTFARISAQRIGYDELPAHTMEIANVLNEVLSKQWSEKRGIEVYSFGVSSVSVSDEDKEVIRRMQNMQTDRALRDPTMAAAHLVGAQAEAMKMAAGNTGGMGAMGAFMGMNMAQGAGGMNAANLFAMGQTQQPTPTNNQSTGGWTCACGHAGNTGKFCAECGKPKPAPSSEWTCPACGSAGNMGKFCAECGKPRPAAEWTCSCGTVNSGKFCQNCGAARG